MTDAVVYYTHDVTTTRKRELQRLAAELPDGSDLWVTGCCAGGDALDTLAGGRARIAAYVRDDLRALPYPARAGQTNWANMRGANDLALLRFYRDHPDYDRYWFIEYDVRYTGRWDELLGALDSSDADLLCTQVVPRTSMRAWTHWETFSTAPDEVPVNRMYSGFLPFCRVTRRLLAHIDTVCTRGWSGHPEALWPTAAASAGYTYEEIGGNSRYTPRERRGRYYGFAWITGVGRLGSFTAWPFYSDKSDFINRTKDVLWHPVKD